MQSIKRLTLQLTPLLDLLLIVIFAQYLEMEQTTQALTEKKTDDLALLEYRLRESQKQLAFTEEVLSQVQEMRFASEEELAEARQQAKGEQAQASNRIEELKQQRESVEDQRNRILQAVKKAYTTSSREISEILAALSATGATPRPLETEQIEELARDLEEAPPRDLATFLMAYEEIRKRCDLWEIHLNDREVFEVTIGEKSYSLRADSEDEFQEKLFNLYKSLPETKGLVIMMVSYGEVRASQRQILLNSLPEVTDQMREDATGRTRFEYAIIGYYPEKDSDNL